MKNPKIKFDQINFSEINSPLIGKKENLYGIVDIIEPKFRSIKEFIYYLSEGVLENGDSIYFDNEGIEY